LEPLKRLAAHPVGEFFAVQNDWIREINAVLFNMPDAIPTGWPTTDHGPGKASAE
jgi:hypothetical protein